MSLSTSTTRGAGWPAAAAGGCCKRVDRHGEHTRREQDAEHELSFHRRPLTGASYQRPPPNAQRPTTPNSSNLTSRANSDLSGVVGDWKLGVVEQLGFGPMGVGRYHDRSAGGLIVSHRLLVAVGLAILDRRARRRMPGLHGRADRGRCEAVPRRGGHHLHPAEPRRESRRLGRPELHHRRTPRRWTRARRRRSPTRPRASRSRRSGSTRSRCPPISAVSSIC